MKTLPLKHVKIHYIRNGSLLLGALLFVYIIATANIFPVVVKGDTPGTATTSPTALTLDKSAYDIKMLQIANAPTSTWAAYLGTSTTLSLSGFGMVSTSSPQASKKMLWPVRNLPYPKPGAILPFNRIVAYYGNFYSKGMGILGEYPEAVVLQKLASTTAAWEKADPTTPVMPAINYIATTAQGSPGKEGLYTLRMPDSQVDKAIAMAAKINGIVILDLQIGLSSLKKELPLLEKYWSMPNVHLGLDPEFAMYNKQKPGEYIGSYDAADINYASNYLAEIVKKNNLPPKVIIVHRFTRAMVTNAKNIKPLPEVQIVMDMDGWGEPAKKINTYNTFIAPEPVQFTGFKIFYKNDLRKPSTRLLTPQDVLGLTPQPMFIQYQ